MGAVQCGQLCPYDIDVPVNVTFDIALTNRIEKLQNGRSFHGEKKFGVQLVDFGLLLAHNDAVDFVHH